MFLKEFLEKGDFEKVCIRPLKHEKLPSMQKVNSYEHGVLIRVNTVLKLLNLLIILMGKRELVALLSLSSWCLVIVVWLFLAVPWVCLQL